MKVIMKARTSCETTGNDVLDHFVDINKMVKLNSGSERETEDRQNKDERKNKSLSKRN
jgi:DNA-damage-inducible protein D